MKPSMPEMLGKRRRPSRALLAWIVVLVVMICSGKALAAYQVGDSVCVQWENDWWWYPGEILEVSGSKARVHYPDYGTDYDQQWVSVSWINPTYAFQVGDAVFVQYDRADSHGTYSVYWLATVIGTHPGEYQVHYDGFDSSWDEWVDQCRVFPKPKVGDAVYAKYYSSYVYAHILSVIDDTWTVRFKGWEEARDLILDWEEDVSSTEIMPCPPGEEAHEEAVLAARAPVPLPAGMPFYPYAAVEVPATPHQAAAMKPIGLGPAALGGSTLDLLVELPRFEALIDVYLGLQIGSGSDILLLGEDDGFHLLSEGLRPWKSNGSYLPSVALYENIPVDLLPQTDYSFYLMVTPRDQVTNGFLWATSLSLGDNGAFTGLKRHSDSELQTLIQSVLADMVSKFDATWYPQLQAFVTSSESTFSGDNGTDPLDILAWAFLNENNVYPFCWSVFKKLEQDPTDPLALNSAAVCFFELDKVDDAGRLLDLAQYRQAGLPMTYENAASYFDKKGNAQKAAEMKLKAAEGEFDNPYAAWDGYQYADSRGLTQTAGSLDGLIPSNFSLLKGNGSMGSGSSRTAVCCSCNGQFYTDVVLCVDECEVSLACFTSICTPNLQCCWQKTPFSLYPKICYPPQGLQVCVTANDKGDVSVEVGAQLLGVVKGYLGFKRDFSGNYTVYLSPGLTAGLGADITLFTTDPARARGAMQYKVRPSVSLGQGFSLGAGLTTSSLWQRSPICDLNPGGS
jgi:hypothetical protein